MKGNIILCCDLNARSGADTNFIENDVYDSHTPLCNNYEYDIVQDIRNSYDKKVDTRGKQLTEFCISTNMRILNGRVFGDLFDKFTCHKPVGSSVVDYVVVSEGLMSNILSFEVSDFLPTFSDCHCKLSFNIMATYIKNSSKCNINMTDLTGGYIWSNSSPIKFRDALCHPLCKAKIDDFLKQDFDSEKAATLFADILKLAASKACIFKKRFYPLQWSSAYITPVFKSGDPYKPENYRGIAINTY
ncbi:Hypothetical predicted protein [Mytilus galloprovincialis]|uniref:Endonuclease/exonuclease/phosphatase domain-containing protein n=1 Tax=Mytilus galloprovincialis TaxID=29158 RepID=A0A8B6EGU2_MYTGA|nr:Hypothetical predicted protein [Mytilus galloprovincialis]